MDKKIINDKIAKRENGKLTNHSKKKLTDFLKLAINNKISLFTICKTYKYFINEIKNEIKSIVSNLDNKKDKKYYEQSLQC